MPPSVHQAWVAGSGPKVKPCGAAAARRSSSTVPGRTRAVRRSGSSSSTPAMWREKSRTTAVLHAWPARLVPPPRPRRGAPWRRQAATAASTSAASRGLREARGWSQKELAQANGIAPGTLSEYESGKLELTRERLEELLAPMAVGADDVESGLAGEPLFRPAPAAPATPVDPTAAERRILKRAAARLVRRVGDEFKAWWLAEVRQTHAAADRSAAEALWRRLKAHPAGERRALVEREPAMHAWALAERLCAESEEEAPGSAVEALGARRARPGGRPPRRGAGELAPLPGGLLGCLRGQCAPRRRPAQSCRRRLRRGTGARGERRPRRPTSPRRRSGARPGSLPAPGAAAVRRSAGAARAGAGTHSAGGFRLHPLEPSVHVRAEWRL